jgi:hypothetical protein
MTLISPNHSAMLLGLKMKRHFLFVVLLIAVAVAGCSSSKKSAAAVKPAVTAPKTIITPDTSLAATVISVNTIGRFVVLDFPNGQLPKLQQTLFIYHGGLKTAEVKITGPQSENNIVADLVSGEAKVGDTVRDQ